MKNLLLYAIISLFCSNLAISQIKISDNSKINDLRPYELRNLNSGILAEELPADFPKIKIDSLKNPTPGYIFMECFTVSNADPNYIMVMNEKGEVVYYDKPENQGVDFKMQPNGRFSYATRVKLGDKYNVGPLTVQNIYVQHKILDSAYKVIDSVQTQNEYLADMHDFRILPNGNYLLIAYEHVNIDMSKIVPGGNPNAVVVGTVIQELDKNKKCVFQWRSLDYIPVLATKDDPRKAIFEHTHGNSLFIDKDGNLITSFPTTFEIVKIDMVTGKMIWRLGGDSNEFEITGDNEVDKPYYFRMQHDAKRLDNGNLLFYDNAVQKKSGWNSRAVEYTLDEENKKADLVWEFKHTPPIPAYAMGSAQRLKNGNTLIDWGLIFTGLSKAITEVTSDKKTAFEISMPALSFSYRANKYDLPACQPIAEVEKYEMIKGNTYSFDEEGKQTGIQMYFEFLEGFMYNAINVKKYDCAPLNPEFVGEAPVILQGRYFIKPMLIDSLNTELRIDANSLAPHQNRSYLKLFVRENEGQGIFEELATSYNTNTQKLIASTTKLGEIIIGYHRNADKIYPPKLMTPVNKKVFVNNTPVDFKWSSTGRYDKFQFQIASDSNFNDVVYFDNTIPSLLNNIDGLSPNKEYFWRVNTSYRDLSSDWSEKRSFRFTEPYLEVIYPNGGEKLTQDSTYIFKWNTNINDSITVTLLRNGVKETTVSDGIISHSNSLMWKIPNNIPEDTKYKLQVTYSKGMIMKGESESEFSIALPVSVNDDKELNIINKIVVSPNPVTDNAKISFQIAHNSMVRLSVVDALGIEKQILVNTQVQEGKYNLNLHTSNYNSGVYFIVLKIDNNIFTEKLVIIR